MIVLCRAHDQATEMRMPRRPLATTTTDCVGGLFSGGTAAGSGGGEAGRCCCCCWRCCWHCGWQRRVEILLYHENNAPYQAVDCGVLLFLAAPPPQRRRRRRRCHRRRRVATGIASITRVFLAAQASSNSTHAVFVDYDDAAPSTSSRQYTRALGCSGCSGGMINLQHVFGSLSFSACGRHTRQRIALLSSLSASLRSRSTA
jgi:hypothetical protein